MQIKDLKAKVEEYRNRLKVKHGHAVTFSETGPVGMQLIDALVLVVEAQEKRITALEKRQG